MPAMIGIQMVRAMHLGQLAPGRGRPPPPATKAVHRLTSSQGRRLRTALGPRAASSSSAEVPPNLSRSSVCSASTTSITSSKVTWPSSLPAAVHHRHRRHVVAAHEPGDFFLVHLGRDPDLGVLHDLRAPGGCAGLVTSRLIGSTPSRWSLVVHHVDLGEVLDLLRLAPERLDRLARRYRWPAPSPPARSSGRRRSPGRSGAAPRCPRGPRPRRGSAPGPRDRGRPPGRRPRRRAAPRRSRRRSPAPPPPGSPGSPRPGSRPASRPAPRRTAWPAAPSPPRAAASSSSEESTSPRSAGSAFSARARKPRRLPRRTRSSIERTIVGGAAHARSLRRRRGASTTGAGGAAADEDPLHPGRGRLQHVELEPADQEPLARLRESGRPAPPAGRRPCWSAPPAEATLEPLLDRRHRRGRRRPRTGAGPRRPARAARTSCSSKISPTSCSSRSSSVTMPRVPPNSSSTTARWRRSRCMSSSRSPQVRLAGAMATGRTGRRSPGPELEQVEGVQHADDLVEGARGRPAAGCSRSGQTPRRCPPGHRPRRPPPGRCAASSPRAPAAR